MNRPREEFELVCRWYQRFPWCTKTWKEIEERGKQLYPDDGSEETPCSRWASHESPATWAAQLCLNQTRDRLEQQSEPLHPMFDDLVALHHNVQDRAPYDEDPDDWVSDETFRKAHVFLDVLCQHVDDVLTTLPSAAIFGMHDEIHLMWDNVFVEINAEGVSLVQGLRAENQQVFYTDIRSFTTACHLILSMNPQPPVGSLVISSEAHNKQ